MSAPKLLIVAGTFYRDIADALIKGAKGAAEAAGATAELVEVPGALEIPGAIVQAEIAEADFDGYVALGCVIRGETTHYDYVCTESARGLMELNLNGVIAGNGILTVENRAQALKRAVDKNKGADAANAALALIALRDRFGSSK
ncbi:6,7-dimethyl-8-ribityllumazine synthase [Maricaulis sp.]|jgi:6,7-dimethyl-8-ribityllumazine synthase|uniref:6,7-dimethyl-8-ribityllumazine synthase n=1 Tax=Maricaulis sp. TaxID=1486257 RepID=UPI001B2977BC|nr:6,7-dimethyl-8-ribityllumazine synthase [Maricaulis sp.]MBO6766514.1 6,7-dimethyl-8-ribityllumazine synthase [Maricaulis sp.]